MVGQASDTPPPLGYPEKFELALRYGNGPLQSDSSLDDSDRLLLDALGKQAQFGPCKEPRPSMWDTVARAQWNAWKELGDRSKMEAMFMYVTAVEEFAPEWWKWPQLGLVTAVNGDADSTQPAAEACETAAPQSSVVPDAFAVTNDAHSCTNGASATPNTYAGPLQLVPSRLATGAWSLLSSEGAPARYRHGCAIVGARLLVFGGRSNSGRLAAGLYQLDLLRGCWTSPVVSGKMPELRWGHSMSTYLQWAVIFGGHRRRAPDCPYGCLNDTTLLDTETMEWQPIQTTGALPPPRGNHAAVVLSDRLWIFGGDAPIDGLLPLTVWWLPLHKKPDPSKIESKPCWTDVHATGQAPAPCADHVAVAIDKRVVLIGGTDLNGYSSMRRLPIFHTGMLSWSTAECTGGVPSSRSGHAAVALHTHCGSPNLYIFGGGNSSCGFADLHELDTSSWKWRCLESASTGTNGTALPAATEGSAMAVCGGMLIVYGGYTTNGATNRCFAWVCPTIEDSEASETLLPAANQSSANSSLVLLGCPSTLQCETYAKAAQMSFNAHLIEETQVVAIPMVDGIVSEDEEADSQELALSLVLQRLQQMQLQHASVESPASSLLSRATLVATLQPCRFTLQVGGATCTFRTFWLGVADVATAKRVVCSTANMDVTHTPQGWGKTSRYIPIDDECTTQLVNGWAALLQRW